MKLCFMGNSHLAAFRLGWDKIGTEYPGAEIEFFGAQGSDLRHFRVDGRKLVTEQPTLLRQIAFTSGGQSSVPLERFDGFLLVGAGSGVCSLMRLLAKHRTFDTTGEIATEHLVSDAVLDISVRHRIKHSLFRRLIQQIRRVSSRPIVVAATPYPRKAIKIGEPGHWTDAEVIGPRLVPLWEEGKEAIAKEFGVVFAEQPAETIEDGFFTRDAFSEGSVRLRAGFDEKHDEDEFKHMNPLYGATFIREIMPALGVTGGEGRRLRAV